MQESRENRAQKRLDDEDLWLSGGGALGRSLRSLPPEAEEEDEECAWAPNSPTGRQGSDLMAAKKARQQQRKPLGLDDLKGMGRGGESPRQDMGALEADVQVFTKFRWWREAAEVERIGAEELGTEAQGDGFTKFLQGGYERGTRGYERYERLKELFQAMDLDGIGAITAQVLFELGTERRRLGQRPGVWTRSHNDRIHMKMKRRRTPGGGGVTETELLSYLDKVLPLASHKFDRAVSEYFRAARECRKYRKEKAAARQHYIEVEKAKKRDKMKHGKLWLDIEADEYHLPSQKMAELAYKTSALRKGMKVLGAVLSCGRLKGFTDSLYVRDGLSTMAMEEIRSHHPLSQQPAPPVYEAFPPTELPPRRGLPLESPLNNADVRDARRQDGKRRLAYLESGSSLEASLASLEESMKVATMGEYKVSDQREIRDMASEGLMAADATRRLEEEHLGHSGHAENTEHSNSNTLRRPSFPFEEANSPSSLYEHGMRPRLDEGGYTRADAAREVHPRLNLLASQSPPRDREASAPGLSVWMKPDTQEREARERMKPRKEGSSEAPVEGWTQPVGMSVGGREAHLLKGPPPIPESQEQARLQPQQPSWVQPIDGVESRLEDRASMLRGRLQMLSSPPGGMRALTGGTGSLRIHYDGIGSSGAHEPTLPKENGFDMLDRNKDGVIDRAEWEAGKGKEAVIGMVAASRESGYHGSGIEEMSRMEVERAARMRQEEALSRATSLLERHLKKGHTVTVHPEYAPVGSSSLSSSGTPIGTHGDLETKSGMPSNHLSGSSLYTGSREERIEAMAHDMAKGRLTASPERSTMQTVRERYGSDGKLNMANETTGSSTIEGSTGSGIWTGLKSATGYLLGWSQQSAE